MSIIILLIIIFLVFFVRKKKHQRLSKLTSLSFVFIVAGIVFSDSRLVSYSFFGAAIVLGIIEVIKKRKR